MSVARLPGLSIPEPGAVALLGPALLGTALLGPALALRKRRKTT